MSDVQSAGRRPAPPANEHAKARFFGVDVARGIALIAMLATNVYDVLNDDGQPTLAGTTVVGRAATMFVMVAGISLAFISGGFHPVQGIAHRAAAVNIAVRGLLIGAIGLALGTIGLAVGGEPGDLLVILPYYTLFFLLAIPLLGLRPRVLACIAGALIVVGPLLRLGAFSLGLRDAFPDGATLGAPFSDPVGLFLQLLVTGFYPAVVYMAYICAGLAIGRLDLSSTRVAVRLLGGGLAMAVAAWITSSVLLFHLGGLQHLQAAGSGSTRNDILWDPDQVASWWWLALRAPHSTTPIDALHTLGSAMAVLGGVLLLTRLRAARRLLVPVAVAGTMTLTIYSAQHVLISSGLLGDNQLALFVLLAAAALAFAVLWQRLRGQGPLERLLSMAAGRARLAVTTAPGQAGRSPTDVTDRAG
jgi:uncharacterized membrane protein